MRAATRAGTVSGGATAACGSATRRLKAAAWRQRAGVCAPRWSRGETAAGAQPTAPRAATRCATRRPVSAGATGRPAPKGSRRSRLCLDPSRKRSRLRPGRARRTRSSRRDSALARHDSCSTRSSTTDLHQVERHSEQSEAASEQSRGDLLGGPLVWLGGAGGGFWSAAAVVRRRPRPSPKWDVSRYSPPCPRAPLALPCLAPPSKKLPQPTQPARISA
eukprot:scaffold8736_cov114-Isochrysis_galbana.AAC.5